MSMDELRWAVERMAAGISVYEVAKSVSIFADREISTDVVARLDFEVYPCYSHELKALWNAVQARTEEDCGSVLSRDYLARKLRQVIDSARRNGDSELMLKALRVGSQLAGGKLTEAMAADLGELDDAELNRRLAALS